MQHLWQNEDPFYNAILEELSFANLIGLDISANPFNVEQEKFVKTNKLDGKLDYYHILNAKSNLNFTLGTTLSTQKFNSTIFETLNGNRTPITNTDAVNDVDFSFEDVFLGLHYKFVSGIFTFNQGFTLHNYLSKNTQLGTEVKNEFTQILPNASIKVNLKKSETLQLSYRMQTTFTDVNSLAKGYVFNNYNSLYAGNRDLENALSHNIDLSYFSFNMFSYTNIFAVISYNKRIDDIASNTAFLDVNQIRTSVNSLFPNKTIFGRFNYDKSFRKFKLTIGGDITYSKSNSLIKNGVTGEVTNRLFKTFRQSYQTKFSTNIRNAPNFDIGYNVQINNSDIGGTKNIFTTHSPYLNLEVRFFKEFNFTSKYTFNQVVNQGQVIDEYGFLRADITYQKKDSSWEYKIGVTNILDSSGLNQNSSNDIFVSNSTYLIQPRIGVLSIKYNL